MNLLRCFSARCIERPAYCHICTPKSTGILTRIRDMILKPLRHLKGTIFVVTYGRSGSTALQSILQTVPKSHIVG